LPASSKPKPPTIAVLAKKLGVGERQVANLLKAGMPKAWPDAEQWHREHKAAAEAKKFGPRRQSAGKERQLELENQILELELQEKKRQLVTETEARRRYRTLAVQAAGAIRTLTQYGDRLLGVTDPVLLDERLEAIINRQLAMLRGEDAGQLELPDAPEQVAA
jgi:hypothetical protein